MFFFTDIVLIIFSSVPCPLFHLLLLLFMSGQLFLFSFISSDFLKKVSLSSFVCLPQLTTLGLKSKVCLAFWEREPIIPLLYLQTRVWPLVNVSQGMKYYWAKPTRAKALRIKEPHFQSSLLSLLSLPPSQKEAGDCSDPVCGDGASQPVCLKNKTKIRVTGCHWAMERNGHATWRWHPSLHHYMSDGEHTHTLVTEIDEWSTDDLITWPSECRENCHLLLLLLWVATYPVSVWMYVCMSACIHVRTSV